MSRRPISIRSKLIALTLMTVLAPIWFVLFLVGTKEIRDIRNDMLQSSAMIASVVADYGAAALAFDSRPAAEQALQVLAENPRFLDATIYDSNGRLFAAYRRDSTTAHAPPVELHETQQRTALEGDRITVVQPIMQGGERYGALLLHTAIAPLVTRVHTYVWDLVWLILGVIAASLALAWALERMVTRRLLRLADVAREVTRREDTQVRAQDRGNDEIGLLAGAFNRMLAEIAHRQKEAREAVRLRDEFLSVASHELKTPLTSLKLRVQGLIDQAPPVADPAEALRLHKSFDLAERQVRRLEKLINSLLDVSRIAIGRFPLQCEEVDLVSMVHNVVGQFSAEIARSGADILLDLPAHARGHWDPLRLEQVVVNLLSNALKYGAGKPIEIAVRCDDDTAFLTVRDHGIGIDAADQRRIFERFERAVSLNYGGLGLGLHIAREIVVAHHGTIHVESERGQGAAFVVAIPRGQRPPAELGEAWTHA
jgi:signal transduction histidine kinase